MDFILRYWQESKVPYNFGEWGVAESATPNNAKGGLTYIKDMLELMKERNVHWQYYFLNRLWSVDCCFEDNPTTANEELIQVFRDHFAN